MKKTTLFIAFVALLNIQVVAQDLLIKNVRIVDPIEANTSEASDLVIKNGLIESIEAHDPLRKIEDVKTVEGNGKYLNPGFINSHIHLALGTIEMNVVDGVPELEIDLSEELPEITLQLLLANGITTARDPGGLTEITTEFKEKTLRNEVVGPELKIAGTIIDITKFKNLVHTVESGEDIINEVQRQKNSGVDYIKLYTGLDSDLTKTGIDHAHQEGLKTIAHLQTTSWTEAAKLGVDNIVHIIPGSADLLPEEHRAAFLESTKLGSIWFYKWFEYVDFESDEIKEMFRVLKEHEVSVDPTLILFHSMFFKNDGIYTSNPALAHLPKNIVADWEKGIDFTLGWTEADFEAAKKVWPKVEEFLRLLHEHDILLTAGTDTNNPWITPGDSFHQELLLYKQAGLSNADILKIATINGAKLMVIDHRTGTIEVGKEADLVLLANNPLDDIAHTSSIEWVIENGVIHTPKELTKSLKSVN
ncbi:MAG: amidohydrolase family protein [Balneolaceae bacterium]|nr:amidohydrolase family protein [Balneolaceae bacterium]